MGKKNRKNRGQRRRKAPANADERRLQGIDEKQFMLNDIVTLSNGSTGIASGQ
jgi:hypothetical protein